MHPSQSHSENFLVPWLVKIHIIGQQGHCKSVRSGPLCSLPPSATGLRVEPGGIDKFTWTIVISLLLLFSQRRVILALVIPNSINCRSVCRARWGWHKSKVMGAKLVADIAWSTEYCSMILAEQSHHFHTSSIITLHWECTFIPVAECCKNKAL